MKAENLEDLVKRFLYKSGNGNQDPELGAWEDRSGRIIPRFTGRPRGE